MIFNKKTAADILTLSTYLYRVCGRRNVPLKAQKAQIWAGGNAGVKLEIKWFRPMHKPVPSGDCQAVCPALPIYTPDPGPTQIGTLDEMAFVAVMVFVGSVIIFVTSIVVWRVINNKCRERRVFRYNLIKILCFKVDIFFMQYLLPSLSVRYATQLVLKLQSLTTPKCF